MWVYASDWSYLKTKHTLVRLAFISKRQHSSIPTGLGSARNCIFGLIHVYCRLSSDIFWTMADAYHLFGWIPRLLQDIRYVVGQARRALLGLSDSQPGLNSASHYCETQRRWHSALQCKVAAVRQFGGRHRPLPVLKERPDRLQPCCKKSSPSVKARTIPNSFPIKI